ncbi:MAG: ABC transporter permease [Spirochaetales bacterium]|nr:ABC transporter permease [Spirochaetales bacterium]
MIRYIFKRILNAIPLLFFVSIFGFILINLPPGDFLTTYLVQLSDRGTTVDQATIETLKARYGLDRPMYQQYFMWIGNFLKGDMGESFGLNRPVNDIVRDFLPATLLVTISTLFFTWLMAIPIGIYSATHQHSWKDNLFTVIGFLGLAVPNFLFALVLLVGGFTIFGNAPIGLFSPEFVDAPFSIAKLIDLLKHLWVPVLVIGTSGTASLIRIMRGNLLDVLEQQFIQTARSKGLSERIVIYKHAVRNALHPLVMQLGMQLPEIFSGAAITSIVLNLPTLGSIYLTAVQEQDMYLAGSFLMIITVLLVVGNLIADILLAVLDPRVLYD